MQIISSFIYGVLINFVRWRMPCHTWIKSNFSLETSHKCTMIFWILWKSLNLKGILKHIFKAKPILKFHTKKRGLALWIILSISLAVFCFLYLTRNQGSQIRQIWRILRQNCSDDSTQVTVGVTSTPEIFGNKHSFVLSFFATNTIYVNCKRCKP